MTVSAAASDPANRCMPERSELNLIYENVNRRIDQAKRVMPGIRLEDKIESSGKIVEEFRSKLAEAGDDADLIKKCVDTARQALLALTWDLDKHIIFAQLNVMYIRVLSAADIAANADLDELESSANPPRFLQLVKQARQVLEAASEQFDSVANKAQLEAIASEASVGFTKIRSTIVKEGMFEKITVLVDQVLKHTPDKHLDRIREATTHLVSESRANLKIGQPDEIITPQAAVHIFVELSRKLDALNPQGTASQA